MAPTNPFEALRDDLDEAKRVSDTIFAALKADRPDAVPFPTAMAAMMLAISESIRAMGQRRPKPRANESQRPPLNPLSSVASEPGLPTRLPSFRPFNRPLPTP